MKLIKSNYLVALILLIFFFVYFVLSVPYYSGDVRNHVYWGGNILEQGSQGFYNRSMGIWSYPNYPPVSMLSFAGAVIIYNLTKSIFLNLNNLPIFPSGLIPWINSPNVEIAFLKIPAIIPFILTGAFVFAFGKLFKKSFNRSLFFMLLFLLNPGFIYLSVLWGQNDFAQILFILGAFYFLLINKNILAYIFAALAILSKQTVLIIWGLFLITVYKTKWIPQAFLALLVSLIVLWFSYLPFNITGPLWPFTYYNETLKSTGFLVADNAINIWGLYSNYDQLDAGKKDFLLTYEHWGFLIFALCFIPILFKYLKAKFSPELLFYFLFLSSIIYFLVFTRMHERYLFFGVMFAHMLVMVNKKYWPNLLFFSILYFLNLYRGLYQPDYPILVEILKNRIFLNWTVVIYVAFIIYNYYCFMFKLKGTKS